ncbi:MAG: helix-turn-helix domain-containing protein [Bacillota bacterium]
MIGQRARYLGWRPEGKHTVLIVDIDDFQSYCLSGRLSEQAIQELKNRFLELVTGTVRGRLPGDHLVAPRSDSVVIVARLPDGGLPVAEPSYPHPLPGDVRATVTNVAARVREAVTPVLPGLTVSLGIGLLCTRPSQIAESFAAAQDALAVGRTLGGGNRTVFYQDLAMHRLLARIGPEAELERFVREEIGPLIEYDRRRGSQLVYTLEVYLDSGCHLERAAARLFVHRNSLKYRLKRIREIVRLPAFEGERLVSLAFAVKAHRVLEERHRAGARAVPPADRPTRAGLP